MISQIRPCLVLFALLSLCTGVVYPVFVTAIAQLVFSEQANGSIVMHNGRALGSKLIGQPFDGPEYFWGRPSATGPVGYNAAASGGSNLGPSNPVLLESVQERVAALVAIHPDQTLSVPVDLVTSSGSGLDPHISPAAAEFQVGRVAKIRKLNVEKVRELVSRSTEGRTFGILGEPRVNVLQLNLSLDFEVAE
jgi:K+-transporting ATPase ATPase C chain